MCTLTMLGALEVVCTAYCALCQTYIITLHYMHLSTNVGAKICIQFGVIDIFQKFKMAILDLLDEPLGPHTKAHYWYVPPYPL